MKKRGKHTSIIIVSFILLLMTGCNLQLSEDKQLIEPDMGFSIVNMVQSKGECYEYEAYEMNNDKEEYYFEIVILEKEKVIQIIRQEQQEYVSLKPSLERLISEVDINFDGKNDILIHRGNFGTQGASGYTCYLNQGEKFIEFSPFQIIFNPKINKEKKLIQGSNRESAIIYSHDMYEFIEGELIHSHSLILDYEQKIATEKQWKNQEWVVVYEYKDWEKEIYAEDTYWCLLSDKWEYFENTVLNTILSFIEYKEYIKYPTELTIEPTQYALKDLDGDQIPEVFLQHNAMGGDAISNEWYHTAIFAYNSEQGEMKYIKTLFHFGQLAYAKNIIHPDGLLYMQVRPDAFIGLKEYATIYKEQWEPLFVKGYVVEENEITYFIENDEGRIEIEEVYYHDTSILFQEEKLDFVEIYIN